LDDEKGRKGPLRGNICLRVPNEVSEKPKKKKGKIAITGQSRKPQHRVRREKERNIWGSLKKTIPKGRMPFGAHGKEDKIGDLSKPRQGNMIGLDREEKGPPRSHKPGEKKETSN